MKIKKELPLFEQKKAFIIVTGKQSANIYLASNGEINLVDELYIPSPSSEYSDNEGHFKRRGSGGVISSGSVREPQKAYLFKKFSTELSKLIAKLDDKEKVQELYLFTPDYIKNNLRNSLTKLLQNKIVMEIFGNYGDSHVFDLLKMINKENEHFGATTPTTKEAQKLMQKKID